MPHRVGGPLPTAARQGREQQKYEEDGARCVAGCIPVRYSTPATTTSIIKESPLALQTISNNNNNTSSAAESARVLMISSRNGKGYVFPKGGWELDESVEGAAQRETVEEAGVRGELELPILGRFDFKSGKPEKQTGQKGRCTAYMFAMVVSEELKRWPESRFRNRFWCTIEEAYQRARYDWMRAALRVWVERNGWADQVTLIDPVVVETTITSSTTTASDSPELADGMVSMQCVSMGDASPMEVGVAPSPETPIAVQN